jgi:cardiolipin synthase A/B
MIHVKVLIVDGLWWLFGSTNFHNRPFGLNDEVNVPTFDHGTVERLSTDFAADLQNSCELTLAVGEKGQSFERLTEAVGWMLQRRQ